MLRLYAYLLKIMLYYTYYIHYKHIKRISEIPKNEEESLNSISSYCPVDYLKHPWYPYTSPIHFFGIRFTILKFIYHKINHLSILKHKIKLSDI